MSQITTMYILLVLAIGSEAVATFYLKLSEQFTKPIPTLITVVGYVVASYLLAIVVKIIPVGVAYAIWSALGIVLISIFGYFFLGENLDVPAYIGLALIIAGVIVLNVFSNTMQG